MRIVWQCESDPYCQRVLRKHWPDIPLHEDVRTLTAPGRVDVLAGGFPCQDVSVAGRRAGIGGERSGLWSEFARLVGDLRPQYVFVENVPGLLVRGMGTVLGDLAALGYDAEWDCLPAAAFGAPHLRARIFVLAYPDSGQRVGPDDTVFAGRRAVTGSGSLADSAVGGRERGWAGSGTEEGRRAPGVPERSGRAWAAEPGVGRVANGVPDRVDRLRALGNAVVPQIAEYVGRRILTA
jgi:DNA (cytosine-5)-methyltransferase 1